MYKGTPLERAYMMHISRNRFWWTTHQRSSRKSVRSRKNQLNSQRFCAPRITSRGKLKRAEDSGYDDTGETEASVVSYASSYGCVFRAVRCLIQSSLSREGSGFPFLVVQGDDGYDGIRYDDDGGGDKSTTIEMHTHDSLDIVDADMSILIAQAISNRIRIRLSNLDILR
ncbi:hypothetical protein BofuT4_P129030.1 [Botrytis cinerea T4]|uniref:Uncharacterized protein n=1 Tax=Botryotinia fuckeliana (strain T4) TaxID=999810 RepID=G2YRF5_BOTF4|nr:hypothetical protein BofuT4_P129030.1 [Botrytis cinerea T4]